MCFLFLGTGLFVLKAQNIQLFSHLPYNVNLSSCWAYYDSINQKEYAIVGTTTGTSIVDITNPTPTQVAFLSGSNTSWREMKVWKHYAYIVHDVSNGSNEGMQIIDLQYLPDSVKTYNIKSFTSNGKNITLSLAHTVFIEDNGTLYLNGGNTKVNGVTISGTTMFDISQNPLQPEYLGHQNAKYVHDCFARDNYLYESEVYVGTQSIYDISDKSNPVLVSSVTTPYAFNHNSWISDDGNYLYTTDEKEYAPIGVYDIHDKSNPILIGTIKNTPNERVIPHNVRVINDYLVVAHYKLGVIIWDVSHPDNIIKVGQYDCSPNYDNIPNAAFHGVWEACPYLPSGNIILSDIEEGLFVVKPTYIRAARLEGTVYDATTNQVLPSATITFLDDSLINSTSNAIGEYKTGRVEQGIFTVSVSLNGYQTINQQVTINNGIVTLQDFYLQPITTNKIENAINNIKIALQNKQLMLLNNQSNLYKTAYISDVLGRKYNNMLSNNTIDLSSLSNGTYFLTFVLNDNTLVGKQFYLH